MLDEQEHAQLRLQFGQKLRLLRRRRLFTQEQLASRIGVGRSFLSRVEHGLRILNYDELCEISEALTLSLSELFKGIESPKHHNDSSFEYRAGLVSSHRRSIL